jgi:Caspase domain/Putative peptidoglycan binding domain
MRTLTLGSTGDDVLALQQALAALGLTTGTLDGRFGWQTQTALMVWQRSHRLPVDGMAGPATLAALGLGAGLPANGNIGIVPTLPVRSGSRSLHIGLNRVDPSAYAGWSGVLTGCENDARTMAAIARAEGYAARLMLTAEARSGNVLSAIAEAARGLVSGETFMLSYSGHGGQVPNRNAPQDAEADQQDETWVTFDRMLIDDELAAAFAAFRPGVNVILMSDSCHSGTVERVVPAAGRRRSRVIPPDILATVLANQGDRYAAIKDAIGPEKPIDANGLALNACQDNQLSQEVNGAGVFTTQVNRLWANGTFRGSYAVFHQRIVAAMPASQTPQLELFGTRPQALVTRTPFGLGTSKARNAQQTQAKAA